MVLGKSNTKVSEKYCRAPVSDPAGDNQIPAYGLVTSSPAQLSAIKRIIHRQTEKQIR